jgi:aminoglycoside phosphotransferase (APT) family kinase protein
VGQDGEVAHAVEVELTGGRQTRVVRVGDTIRVPEHARSSYVASVLDHLERVGFTGAPRALGTDDQGRRVLSYVEGQVPPGLPFDLGDEALVAGARLVRAFHDATAGSPLCAGQEVVCHGDLGPHNTVFRDDRPVALIDWDDGVGPGRRAVDFAHAVWCFADLTDGHVAVAEQARRAAVMCAEYPGMTTAIVVEELAARFGRARADHEAAGRLGGVEVFDGLLGWLDRHGATIAGAPA